MHLALEQLEVPIFDTDLRAPVAQALGLKASDIRSVLVLRRSLDARQHRRLRFIYRLAVEVPEACRVPAGLRAEPWQPIPSPVLTPVKLADAAPVVVGAGPAGLFAALALCEAGLPPVILERGKPIPERAVDVTAFWRTGALDPESNMYFGEGGAGTFSDGKLTTRSKHPWTVKILRELVAAGAPDSILYDTRSHLGTDVLSRVIPALRAHLVAHGAVFRFGATMTGLRRSPCGRLELQVAGAWQPAWPLVLACGHSAFDTYRLLLENGVALGTKGNAFGCRIEHPAEFITRHFYGQDPRVREILGHAPYAVTAATGDGEARVYSFCCCPGGEVVACATVSGQVSVNGMSFSRREAPFTNAGLVAQVAASEFADSASAALAWRETVEKRCFELGGGGFVIPAQRPADFLAGRVSSSLPENSSRRPLLAANLATQFPPFIVERLRAGLRALERQVPGWLDNGLLLGAETTTSAPLRILRTPHGESENVPGLLPVGEGSGQAGGIVTSALDGYQQVAAWLSPR